MKTQPTNGYPRVCKTCVELWQDRRHTVWCSSKVDTLCLCHELVDFSAQMTWSEFYYQNFFVIFEATYMQHLPFLPTTLLDIMKSYLFLELLIF